MEKKDLNEKTNYSSDEIKTMNIYAKIQLVKQEISDTPLKKTGKNEYSGFDYFQLDDIMPAIIYYCTKYRLFTKVNFQIAYSDVTSSRQTFSDNSENMIENDIQTERKKIGETAVLTIINIDNPSEKEEWTSDVKSLSLKGANEIQAYGGVQTYLRRYNYMNAFDITDSDMFDSNTIDEQKYLKKVKKSLNNLIELEKAAFLKLTNSKVDEEKQKSKEIGSKLKELGYQSFKEVKDAQNVSDIVALAEALNVEVPEDLKQGK